MSLNVLVIAEDYRLDQYVLKPLVEKMMAAVGQPRARVQMCMDPFFTGVDHVLKLESLREIVDTNRLADLYLLIVDRDGKEGRETVITNREAEMREVVGDRQAFVGALAWQEVEVWLLGGHDTQDFVWEEVRASGHPKEDYFDPFSAEKGVESGPGYGRKALAEEMARRYSRVCQRCPEVQDLEDRIRAWLAERG